MSPATSTEHRDVASTRGARRDASRAADPSGSVLPDVRVLTDADRSDAARVLVRAFDGDPVANRLLPSDGPRRRWADWYAHWQLRGTLPYGTSYGIADEGRLAAVALWLPPAVVPGSIAATAAAARALPAVIPSFVRMTPRLAAMLAFEFPGLPRLQRQRARAIEAASAGPTWHLAFLAVEPQHQGRGLARRLLDHVLDRCDADGTAAWLETTDPVNPPRYERFGFVTVRQVPATERLPGLWVMRREPR
jgi:GNAT superfamily N-acetyltransferase